MSQETDAAEINALDSFTIPSVPLEVASFEREHDQQDERAVERSNTPDENADAQAAGSSPQETAALQHAEVTVADAVVEPSQLEIDLVDGVPDPVRDGNMALPQFPADMDMQHGTADEPPDLLPEFDTPAVMNPDGTPVINRFFVDEMLEPEITTEARMVMREGADGTVRAPLNSIIPSPGTRPARPALPPLSSASGPAAAVAAVASAATPIPLRAPKAEPEAASDAAKPVDLSDPKTPSPEVTQAQPPKADNLVFEYGPLAGFAHQIGNLIDQNAVSANGAMKLRDTVNRLISVAVQENPTALFNERGIPFPANTEQGLDGRMTVLQKLKTGLTKELPPTEVGDWEVQSSNGNLVKLVETAVHGEIARIEGAKNLLQPPTLAQAVIGGVSNVVKGLLHNGEKAADVREFRNHQLNESLASLEGTAKEFKKNAGDAGWMASHGNAALLSARDHRERIGDLAADLSGQLDQGLFSKRLKGISEDFGEAHDTVAEEKAKKELAQMIESITDMVTRLAEKVKNLFQPLKKPQP